MKVTSVRAGRENIKGNGRVLDVPAQISHKEWNTLYASSSVMSFT